MDGRSLEVVVLAIPFQRSIMSMKLRIHMHIAQSTYNTHDCSWYTRMPVPCTCQ